MNMDTKIELKFTKLLEEGQTILSRSGWNGQNYSHFPSEQDYQRWRTETLNLVKRVCGETSEHYLQLRSLAEDKESKTNPYFFKDCYGILEAAHNDYSDDFLFNVKASVRAELFSDFLEQAEYLLQEGFRVAAASICGAVLEDGLRKICDAKGLPYEKKTKLETLNILLGTREVYNKLTQKEITAKGEIRNNADHGHFDNVKAEDVKDMISWVRRFLTEHLI